MPGKKVDKPSAMLAETCLASHFMAMFVVEDAYTIEANNCYKKACEVKVTQPTSLKCGMRTTPRNNWKMP
jgi:hypothetical protein